MSPLGLNRRRITVTGAYNLPHVILNVRRNQGYPLPRQVSSPRAAADRCCLRDERVRSRLSDSVYSLLHYEELLLSTPPPPFNGLFIPLYSLCSRKSQSKQEKPFCFFFFFFTTLSLYLLQLLPLHYPFLIFFMHCPRGIFFSLLPTRRCSFSNFCSAPGVAVGFSQFLVSGIQSCRKTKFPPQMGRK